MKSLHILGLLYESMYKDENVKGLGEFLYQLTEKHPSLIPHLALVRDFIIRSGCPEIKIMPLRMGLGASLKNFVLISPVLLNSPLEFCLYGLFHEIAHQYQYKKYGDQISKIFLTDKNMEKNAMFLRKIELGADSYALKKCRDLARQGVLDGGKIRNAGVYSSFEEKDFKKYLKSFRKVIKLHNISDVSEMDDIFYEYITGEKLRKLEPTMTLNYP